MFGIELPIILAPMAGPVLADMVIAVSEAGGLGCLPCALLTPSQARAELELIRQGTSRPFGMNFFCHQVPVFDQIRELGWQEALAPYYQELEIPADTPVPVSNRSPFDEEFCRLVEEYRPAVVSFHFGLPAPDLLERVRATGARIISSATTVAEAIWLEQHCCDAIIAQGAEAGGHRGMFLTDDVSTQMGTMALLPQVVDAVSVPVIAAGGISDARGIVAALALGASAVQLGTAYMLCPEAKTSSIHRQAMKQTDNQATALTNIFTGRPARGIVNRLMREIGPFSNLAPSFPLAGGALAPLKQKAEALGVSDFTALWVGEGFAMCREVPAFQLTRLLKAEVDALLDGIRTTGGPDL
ncbi:nitronate monooxygenase [Agrobacterium vitis]|uniref:NAD(P)H-dependent flavin oxidoreductase n=1 Tax=Agrobacterium vitis TaxID=373 RepID=UPI001F1F29EA|nr:nitronate monooxygenase [Agrobacterium vitis]